VTYCYITSCYGVATISRLLKIIGLFGKRAQLKRLYSAKETYNFKEPTNRSHLMSTINYCYHDSLIGVVQRECVGEGKCVAVYYSVLQCVSVCCSVLQCVAVCFNLSCAALQSLRMCWRTFYTAQRDFDRARKCESEKTKRQRERKSKSSSEREKAPTRE